jgi:hypothetical protein
MINSTSPNEAH